MLLMYLNHSQNTLTTFAGINVLLPNFKPTLLFLCRLDFYFASWLTVIALPEFWKDTAKLQVEEGTCRDPSSYLLSWQFGRRYPSAKITLRMAALFSRQAPSSPYKWIVWSSGNHTLNLWISALQDLLLSSFLVDFPLSSQGCSHSLEILPL